MSQHDTPPTTPNLPPDPDCMNGERAAWADLALIEFRNATGSDPGDDLCDLLADLMHWADRNDQDFAVQLQRASDHYRAETTGDGPLTD